MEQALVGSSNLEITREVPTSWEGDAWVLGVCVILVRGPLAMNSDKEDDSERWGGAPLWNSLFLSQSIAASLIGQMQKMEGGIRCYDDTDLNEPATQPHVVFTTYSVANLSKAKPMSCFWHQSPQDHLLTYTHPLSSKNDLCEP